MGLQHFAPLPPPKRDWAFYRRFYGLDVNVGPVSFPFARGEVFCIRGAFFIGTDAGYGRIVRVGARGVQLMRGLTVSIDEARRYLSDFCTTETLEIVMREIERYALPRIGKHPGVLKSVRKQQRRELVRTLPRVRPDGDIILPLP